MFEDMKAQWRERLKPDYVLVDSRTGHTDVGGICTRHLSDAVVALFVPNNQNVQGVQVVANAIRAEKVGPRQRDIKLHFVPSNVPDIDDLDGVLEQHLARAREQLAFHKPAAMLHHYPSLALLDQHIFTLQLPKSRLAAEHRQLVDAVMAGNLDDADGVVLRLDEIAALPELPIQVEGRTLPQLLESVVARHQDDDRILFRAAAIYRSLGNPYAATRALERAIQLRGEDWATGQERLGSACMDAGFVEHDKAVKAFGAVLGSASATVQEVESALGGLSALEGVRAETLHEQPAIQARKPSELLYLAYGAEPEIQAVLCELVCAASGATSEERSDAERQLSLALIGLGRFSEAQALLERARSDRQAPFQALFNLAMAEWGVTGAAPGDLLDRFLEVVEAVPSRQTSVPVDQRVALACFLRGRRREAKQRVGAIIHSMQLNAGAEFSDWRYRVVRRVAFVDDLVAMGSISKVVRCSQPS